MAKPPRAATAAGRNGKATADASLAERADGYGGGGRAYGGGYEGARLGRRLRGWVAERRTINALLQAGGEQLRARARQLCRENPYAANAAEAYTAAMVGAGIVPSSLLTDAKKKDDVQRLWNAWIEEADADGLTDLYGLQALAARAQFEAGECFIRMRPRRLSDGLTVPLQVQLLESEMLPYSKNETVIGGVIREGIEFDRIGRRVAYHFYTSHPGETYPLIFDFQTTRVPASEVLHLFKPLRPGQIRGQPQITPSMVRFYLLDLYDDAELDRKRVAAMFAGFVTKKGPDNQTPLDTLPGGALGGSLALGEPNSVDTALAPLEPGQLQVLMEGEDIKFSSPSEVGGSYEAFMWRNLLACCAGCGVPYPSVTMDSSKSNYSSSREQQVEFRRRIDMAQHLMLVHLMCKPIWKRWFETAVLSGALPFTPREIAADRSLVAAKWIPPKWDWVDPWKDRKAVQLALEMGTMSRYDAIEMEGEDPVDTDRRIKLAQDSEIAGPLHFRPVAERLNVNIAAEAESPDAAVDAAESRGEAPEGAEPPPAAAPKAMTRKRLEAKAIARAKREDPLFAAHLAELDAIERGGPAH